jgi:hypothetical protein
MFTKKICRRRAAPMLLKHLTLRCRAAAAPQWFF